MYKVFINDTSLILAETNEFVPNKHLCESRSFTGKKDLEKLIRKLSATSLNRTVLLHHYDIDELFYALRRVTKYVPAAGGIVSNEHGEILFIHRRGRWDLPKGKLDKNEHPRNASVREVQEECGLQKVEFNKHAYNTYHIYKQDGKLCLKKTFWYFMKASSIEVLNPQLEEQITEVKWVSLSEIPLKMTNTFSAINELMQKTLLSHKSQ